MEPSRKDLCKHNCTSGAVFALIAFVLSLVFQDNLALTMAAPIGGFIMGFVWGMMI